MLLVAPMQTLHEINGKTKQKPKPKKQGMKDSSSLTVLVLLGYQKEHATKSLVLMQKEDLIIL